MIICLYGPDSYRRNNKLRDLVREYLRKYTDADMVSIDLEENPDSWLRIKEFLNQPSIFTDSKVVVIKESGSPEGKEWPKILKSHLETKKTFLLISDKDKPKKTFQFLLEKPSQVQPFLELENGTLEFFARREAGERGLDFSPEAWQFFISYLNSRTEKSWAVVNELQKIALAGFNPPAGKPLSVSDLRSVIDWFAVDNVFSLAKELLRPGSTLKKIGFLERLFLRKEEPAHLFNLLAYQSWGENAARLADYDISIKSGRLGYEEALLDFALFENE